MKKSLTLIYGLLCYLAFLATSLYAAGFVADVGVPRSIDSAPSNDTVASVMIDLCLILTFALQHSGMARPAFKRWAARLLPAYLERSTFVLASSVALALLFAFWQPLGGVVWSVQDPFWVAVLYVVELSGWLLVFVSTFLIDHWGLFGLRQTRDYFSGTLSQPVGFTTPGLYRVVRHPLYLGFIIAFSVSPRMTYSHLVFAAVTTLYILLAIRLEEHDLVSDLGESYRQYCSKVPMLIPHFRTKRG